MIISDDEGVDVVKWEEDEDEDEDNMKPRN